MRLILNNEVSAPCTDEDTAASNSGRAYALLATDNPADQQIACVIDTLETLGYRVKTADSGRHAVAQWLEHDFMLVVVQCQLPDLDGFDVSRGIRALEGTGRPRTPIIGLSANALDADRQRGMQAGMDECLSQRFERDDLLAVLRRWLREAA